MERNSDVVKMSSFAPLLEHFDMAEWSVSEISLHHYSFLDSFENDTFGCEHPNIHLA